MSFRKVSSIVRDQAMTQFNKKRQEVIHNALRKHSEKTNQNFEDVLAAYMSR